MRKRSMSIAIGALVVAGAAALIVSSQYGQGPEQQLRFSHHLRANQGAHDGADVKPIALRAAYIHAVQREAGSEYAIAAGPGHYRAEQPNLQAAFSDEGQVQVTSEQASLTLRLGRVGRGANLRDAVAPDSVEVDGNRLSFQRGTIEEWYLHGPLGLEQGFTLTERPEGSGPLVLAMHTGGSLRADRDDRGVVFADTRGTARIRYQDAFAADAVGRSLPVQVALRAGALSLVVDDTGATYPVVVDPLIVADSDPLVAGDGAVGDEMGLSVAVSDDTAIVGAPEANGAKDDEGAAYVFVRSGDSWAQQQKLVPDDPELEHQFGFSVAIDGDTAVVGANQAGDGVDFALGAAYVFVRSGDTWSQQQKLTAEGDAAANDMFGASVAVSGDRIIVGAPTSLDGREGAAYVFIRSGTTWTRQQVFTAGTDASNDDLFGAAVTVEEDTVLVGAPLAEVGATVDQGSVTVFLWAGNTWARQGRLVADDGVADDQFGGAVALSGDSLIVGARLADVGGEADQGAAYVFTRSGLTWNQQQKLVDAEGASGEYFGTGVGISGSVAIAGANKTTVGAVDDQGAAFVFRRSEGTWAQEVKLTSSDISGDAEVQFGRSTAISAQAALVGAPMANVGANANQGKAYVYLLHLEDGDACTEGEQCSSGNCVDGVCCDTECGGGVAGDCQSCNAVGHVGTCWTLESGTVCRDAAGACDLAENCDGESTACPDDEILPLGSICRPAQGDCDVSEVCDGATVVCPEDALAPVETVCRSAAGPCDEAEKCDGQLPACPEDAKKAPGVECRPADGVCDVAEACDGSVDACPPDGKQPAGTECRAKADECDVAEACDGDGKDCPSDVFEPDDTPCTDGSCQAGECRDDDTSTEDRLTGAGCTCDVKGRPDGAGLLSLLVGLILVGLRRRRRRRG